MQIIKFEPLKHLFITDAEKNKAVVVLKASEIIFKKVCPTNWYVCPLIRNASFKGTDYWYILIHVINGCYQEDTLTAPTLCYFSRHWNLYIYNSFKMASFCEDVHFYVILRKEQMWVP